MNDRVREQEEGGLEGCVYELVELEARKDDDFWRGNGVLYGLRTLVHFSHFGSRRVGVVEYVPPV